MPKIKTLETDSSDVMGILLALRYLSREASGAGLSELARNLREVEVKYDQCIETMPISNPRIVLGEIKDVFPQQPLMLEKAADKLKTQLTDAYEAALYQGMIPTDALQVVLCWTSAEMMRIQQDQRTGCQ